MRYRLLESSWLPIVAVRFSALKCLLNPCDAFLDALFPLAMRFEQLFVHGDALNLLNDDAMNHVAVRLK